MEIVQDNKLQNFFQQLNRLRINFISSLTIQITFLLLVKILFQLVILYSGYRWLSADDYCRTVKSYEWMIKPEINSGVWLTPHFWFNGVAMFFIKDLFTAALIVNFVFSSLTVYYFYSSILLCFDKKTAFFSTLIFCLFPFQVWLSISGLPESIFFFFVIAGIYYFIKWKSHGDNKIFLILSAVSFALSNGFRYEGWLFSGVLVLLVLIDILLEKKITKKIIISVLISLISFTTIIWWLIQNYVDHQNMFFFAEETTKIFKEFNTAGFLQRLVQYPTFIFFIAPLTTFFGLKTAFETLKSGGVSTAKYFLLFNLLELSLLMLQGMIGTGGTNMISRYIVINALLFIPFAVQQVFEFKRIVAVGLLALILLINIVWSFYYPQPFREDTFEVGKLLNDMEKKNYIKENGKIYFEEVTGYYDIFAVQALSNNPSKFILGDFPAINSMEKKKKSGKKKQTDEELNIIELKNYLEKQNIKIAVVKSDSYTDKLKKLSYKNEEIGDYKLFYLEDLESNVNDSSISLFTKNIIKLEENQEIINFNKLLALKNYNIDNTNFGLNPQTVTLNWGAISPYIIDSIDYENFEYDRYISAIDLRSAETDSAVYTTFSRIFSDRNIEDLIENNNVRNIVVLKPFAILNYSKKYGHSPFEGGVYKMDIRLWDSKLKKDLIIFRGDSLLKKDTTATTDTIRIKTGTDSIKTVNRKISNSKKDSLVISYNLGTIIAMFPDTDYNKVVNQSSTDIYRMLMRNGLQVFFSQRYQGDQFLKWVFNYF
ncbi:MAG TPA: glycosyltransferase family 39 protein [Ignavibacteria bacterium]|nr:glycosyltransferase family 39 protein [Ignavibacteria bacterium]